MCIYIYIYIERERERDVYTYIYIYTYKLRLNVLHLRACGLRARNRELREAMRGSEGGRLRLKTLIELEFLNSSFSNLSSYRNQTVNYLSSDSRQQYLSQQYPTPLLKVQTRMTVYSAIVKFYATWFEKHLPEVIYSCIYIYIYIYIERERCTHDCTISLSLYINE